MRKTKISTYVLIGVILSCLFISGCSTWENIMRNKGTETNTEKSRVTDRIVSVFDDNGHMLKQYEGKLDVQVNENGNKVSFNLNGKQIALYNVRVIVEEK